MALPEGKPQRNLVGAVLHARKPAHDVVVRIAQPKRGRQVHLRDTRKRVPPAQRARYPAVLPLEHPNTRPPAASYPETVPEDEHRVHVKARRPLEILLDQQARTEP